MKVRSNRNGVLAVCAGLTLACGAARAAQESSGAEGDPAPDAQPTRAERGIGRFFGTDRPLLEVPCELRGLGTPMSIKAVAEDAPDPRPFRGMELHPMFDEDGRPLVSACYDPFDPPPEEVMLMVEAAMAGLDRFHLGSRWSGTQGTPRNLRWSFVPDGLSIPSGIGEPTANSTLFATMDSKFSNNRALWVSLFEQSFQRWADLSGLTYQRIQSGTDDWDDGAAWGSSGSTTRGDVRIGMKPIDGGSNVLAYNSFPSGGDMVLDSAENWQSSGNSFRFARNIIMHEHGHGIGIEHNCPVNNSKLMEPFLSTSFDGPRQDDVRASHRHYGDVFGSIGTLAAAADLGALGAAQTLSPSTFPAGVASVPSATRTSIDNNSELDFFKFTVASPLTVNISLVPVGTNYANYEQNFNGSCPSTTTANENAIAIRDLAFDVLNGSGQVLFTADANGIGLSESKLGILLSPAGTWAVRVRSTTNNNSNVQLYGLTVTGVSLPTMNATDGDFNDRVRVSWSSITGASEYRILRGTTTNKNLATQVGTAVPPATQFDDLTAVAGVTYQYWVDVVQDTFVKPLGGPDAGNADLPPDPTGACCVGVVCQVLTESACDLGGGTYLGDSTACTLNVCAPQGACCLGVNCQRVTEADCAGMGGTYLGDTVTCVGEPCAPTGACCVGTVCQALTESACAAAFGEFLGEFVPCLADTCSPTGACCVGTNCQIATETACASLSGSYLGDDSQCLAGACDPTGACCIGESCQIVTQAACGSASGSYLGDGATCDSSPCAVTPCPGDYNADDVVDLGDLIAFNTDWQPNIGQNVPAGTLGDYTGDGVVDLADLISFNTDWQPNIGTTCP